MNIFSIDLTLQEITLMRQSLDVITITGKDAKFVGNLQYKLESEIQQIQKAIQSQELQKQQELEAAVKAEARKQKREELKAEAQS